MPLLLGNVTIFLYLTYFPYIITGLVMGCFGGNLVDSPEVNPPYNNDKRGIRAKDKYHYYQSGPARSTSPVGNCFIFKG